VADGKPVEFPISLLSVVLFVGQVLIVWIAFLLLPFSKEKGRQYTTGIRDSDGDGVDDDAVGRCCGRQVYKNRGGRLAQLFIYDVLTFILAGALAAAAYEYVRLPANATGIETVPISLLGDLDFIGADVRARARARACRLFHRVSCVSLSRARSRRPS
jgi:hypothetical protein